MAGEGGRVEVGQVEGLHLDARVALERVGQDPQVAVVDVRRHDQLAAGHVPREGPDSGADLEDPLPQVRRELAEEPAVVLLGPGQPHQRLVAGVHVVLVVHQEPVLQGRPQGGDAVGPPDLLAFPVAASRVGDRHLVDARAHPGQLGGQLGLDAEAVRPDHDAPGEVGPHRLVARLHVRQVQVGDGVGDQGQELVRDVVPEEEHPARRAGEPGAEDRVGPPVHDRPDQPRVLLGVVLEVRVLDEQDVAPGLGKAPADRGALALVPLLVEDAVSRSSRRTSRPGGPRPARAPGPGGARGCRRSTRRPRR